MTHDPGTAARPGRRVLLAALCLVLVAAATVLVVLAFAARDTERPPGGGYGSAAERADVLAVAEQFALRMNSYGPADLAEDGTMPAYRERVGELLTAKFATSFKQQVVAVESIVAQAKFEVKAEVNAIGVASLDDDRATVLVAWETTRRLAKQEFGDPRQTRSEITLVKVKGDWRIDDFEPVTGEVP